MTSDDEVLAVEGSDWWLEIGPVDMNGTLVTIQKNDRLVAAISRRHDGRLRVSVFELLDEKSASSLTSLSVNPHPVHGVAMRENNWEYALDNSTGMGQAYAAERGESYLSFWEKGIGVFVDGSESNIYRLYKDLVARNPREVAVELMAYSSLTKGSSGKKRRIPKKRDAPEKERSDPHIPPWKSKRQQRRTTLNRFLGCMLGGAVGDALGAPVESRNDRQSSPASAQVA